MNALRKLCPALTAVAADSGVLAMYQTVAPLIYDCSMPVPCVLARTFPRLATAMRSSYPSGIRVVTEEIRDDQVSISRDRVVPFMHDAGLLAFDVLSLHPATRLVVVDEEKCSVVNFSVNMCALRSLSGTLAGQFGTGHREAAIIRAWANAVSERTSSKNSSSSKPFVVCVILSLSLLFSLSYSVNHFFIFVLVVFVVVECPSSRRSS